MVFHLRELRKCYQQSTGSAAKLLQANQLKHHSLQDRSEQSSTVWISFLLVKRALEQIPFPPPPKESNQPLQRKVVPVLWVGWEGAAASPSQAGPCAAG